MNELSQTAMVLAAGEGRRLRPLTLTKPKPLFEVGGKAMLDWSIDKLVNQGIRRVVVNTFYLADQIEAHLAKRTDVEIVISREDELLDSGGGIKKVLRYFDGKPFYTINADLPWIEGNKPSLQSLAEMWNPAQMDALLLVMETRKARGFSETGDFLRDPDGKLRRHNVEPPRPVVNLGAQIIKPELYAAEPEKIFSSNVLWHKAEDKQRLYGFLYEGTCHHVGTPKDLDEANHLLQTGKGWGRE